jgi:hypothetical protein
VTFPSNILMWVPRTILDAARTLDHLGSGTLEIQLALSVILVEVRNGDQAWVPQVARRLARHAPRMGHHLVPFLADRRATDGQVEFVARVLLGAPALVPDVLVAAVAERAPGVAPDVVVALLRGSERASTEVVRMVQKHWATSGIPQLVVAAGSGFSSRE